MTLEEAIIHAKEVAEEKRKDYERACALNIPSEGCYKCAKEHEQLAGWLEELERRRELSERNRPISELLVDVQVENAILTKALELSCIDRSNYKELIDAYLEKAREEE